MTFSDLQNCRIMIIPYYPLLVNTNLFCEIQFHFIKMLLTNTVKRCKILYVCKYFGQPKII